MLVRLKLPALLLAMVSYTAAQAAPLYKVNVLSGPAGADQLYVRDLNNAGQVVGWAKDYSYLWSAQGTTQFQKDFSAQAINNHGMVAGIMFNVPDNMGNYGNHAYTYFNQAYQRATGNTQGVINKGSSGSDINDSGTVVGGNYDGYAYVPARFEQRQIKEFRLGYGDASAINASGTIVGTYEFTRHEPMEFLYRAFIYENGALHDIPAGEHDSVFALGLNDANKVVGYIATENQQIAQSYIYANGQLDKLDVLGASYSQASDINNHDQVVGTYGEGFADQKPFLYDGGTPYDLNGLLRPGTGLTVTRVAGINDFGQIAGQGCDSKGNCYAVLLSAVPEPHTWGMLLAGLGLAGWMGRRKHPAA